MLSIFYPLHWTLQFYPHGLICGIKGVSSTTNAIHYILITNFDLMIIIYS